MTPKTVEYYDWINDVGPAILKNLNELLVADGVEPLRDLHGGSFLDNKWVKVLDSNDYRNYWHVYLELFGERMSNDQYQVVYFPDSGEDWDYAYERADEFCSPKRSGYEHTDPQWARLLVTATKKWVDEYVTPDEYGGRRVVFWWSW